MGSARTLDRDRLTTVSIGFSMNRIAGFVGHREALLEVASAPCARVAGEESALVRRGMTPPLVGKSLGL